jgi:hypothetical protein
MLMQHSQFKLKKTTMINRITMETVACLRSKWHLKQNLIPSWPWSFRHTSCISDFRCKTKYTNKNFCRTPGPAYLAVLPVLVIFCPLGPTNFKKSAVPNSKFTGHSYTPQRRCSDSYWSFGPVMNNLLLDQSNYYRTLPHVRQTLGRTVYTFDLEFTYW